MIKKFKIHIIFYCWFWFFIGISQTNLNAQNGDNTLENTLEMQTAVGVSVPNHPRFTPIIEPAFYTALVAGWATNDRTWGAPIGAPLLRIAVSRQSLGNSGVLGNAYGVVPSLQFLLLRRQKWTYLFGAGLGISYMDKPYLQNVNEKNTVIGSAISFFGAADLAVKYRLNDNFQLGAALLLTHYSNGNYKQPNLGVNIASPCLSISYHYKYNKKNTLETAVNTNYTIDKNVHLFLRGSYGLTERGLDGPKYPVYIIGVGAARRVGAVHRFTAGAEYIYNTSPYQFLVHTGQLDAATARTQTERGVIFVGHELLMGHVGFVTEGGVYLNKHYSQHSWISTKIGFNFYPQHQQKHSRLQAYLGTYIRAYFGEAEFVEVVGGFLF